MAVVTGTTAGLTVEGVEVVEQAEEIESLLSRCGDGERVSCTGSAVGLGPGAGGDIVVAGSSVRSFGGVFEPGDGMNGGASMFKGFPDASPPIKEGVIVGMGRDLIRI